MEKGFIRTGSMRKTSKMDTHLISTSVSTLKKVLMSVENVGNPLRIVLLLLYIREFTQEKGLTSVETVENFLHNCTYLKNTGKFTVEKDLMSAENVGNPLRKKRILLYT
jgi:hypothetical protein